MATKVHFLIFLSIFLISATLVLSSESEGRELRRCKERCGEQAKVHPGLQRECERRCEEQQKHRRESGEERGEKREERGERGQGPRERLQECLSRCQQCESEREQLHCEQRCQEKYRSERQEQKEGSRGRRGEEEEEEEEEEGGTERRQREGKSHYIFGKDKFIHRYKNKHGYFRILRKFHELSDLLIGIRNYRLGVLELNPLAFARPHHFDSEILLYVAKGNGVINMLCPDGRVTAEVREGDIWRVPAGTTVYVANKDRNERFVVVSLLQPVGIPGEVAEFFVSGSPDSYLSKFDPRILEAAYNARRDTLEKMFAPREFATQVSEDQIRSMEQGGKRGQFGQSDKPFNLLRKRPTHSSKRGRLQEADGDDYPPLKQLDIKVSFLNITSESMFGPFFDSKSFKVGITTKGKACIQMVCPHIARRSQRRGEQEEEEKEGQGQQYQLVKSDLEAGSVVALPPGHPAVVVTSSEQNLEMVWFEIRAEGNQLMLLAAKKGVLVYMDDAAKELTFGTRAREADQVLKGREGADMFLPAPDEGRRRPLSSIMDFVGF